ncbi:MAG: DUF3990 domain-containing protein [Culturomica sp.]|jgi:hypothetical protein|nr:DUF3990 domain-containing protein [Culturomica sp.]
MKVYHGSDTLIDVIDLAKCKPNKDFGRGFYVTKLQEQASDMAKRISKWSGNQPFITEFEFEEYAFEDEELNTLRFEVYDTDWLDFIVQNRNRLSKQNLHEYDIIEGPVADDAVSVRIDAYLDGLISRNDFLEEMKFKKTTHQICFCTMRSLQYLKSTTAKPDGLFYLIDEKIIKELILSDGLPEQVATDLYFSSDTYKDFTAGKLNGKSWVEIYEILKKQK